jgi:catechol 2,3-dioxygenase
LGLASSSKPAVPAGAPRFAYLFLTVADLPAARDFYRDTLGLALLFSDDESYAFFALGSGGAQLAVYAGEPPPRHENSPLLAFDVVDLEAARERLAGSGVGVGAIVSVSGGRMFEFRDPAGHRLEFHQPHSA